MWCRLRTLATRMRSAALGTALWLFAGPLIAQDVSIVSQQGALSVEGRFIGYDGTYLQLETTYGPLSLLYENVECVGAACPLKTGYVPRFRLAGAEKMTRTLLPALLQSFARARKWTLSTIDAEAGAFELVLSQSDGTKVAVFDFRPTTTEEGFADLIAHEADLVLAGRGARADEVERAREVGIGNLNHPRQRQIVGLDPIIFVAPGSDAPVPLFEISTLHAMSEDLAQSLSNVDMILHQNRADFDAALLSGNAIGVMSLSDRFGERPVPLVDSCGFLSLPDTAGFKTLDYPFANPIYIYGPERRQHGVLRDFLAWIETDAAQRVVRRSGFVDQDVSAIPLGRQGLRLSNAIRAAGTDVPLGELQRMLRVLDGRTRMTQSYRFEEGSTRLDALSLSSLRRLADDVKSGDYANRDIMFVGFTDSRGAAAANRDLSSARAEEVKRAFLQLFPESLPQAVTVQSAAFGEALPVACDDTALGRNTNRRVELWVGPQG